MYIVLLVGKLGYERPWDNLWASTFVSQTEKLARVKALMGGLMMAQYGFNVQEKKSSFFFPRGHPLSLGSVVDQWKWFYISPFLWCPSEKKLWFLRGGAGRRNIETYREEKLDWFSWLFKNNQFVFGVLIEYYRLTEQSNKSGRHSFASSICFHNLRFKAL